MNFKPKQKSRYVLNVMLACIALGLTACADPYEYGPWDGFVYVQQAPNEFTLKSQGRYDHLDQCMRTLQSRVARNGYPYYCGFDCDKDSAGQMDCTKILGYPELN